MRKSNVWLILAVQFCFGISLHAADFKLASIFSDGMVVQRNQPVPVWGEGNPNSQVDVQLGDQKATANVSSDGRWQVALNPLPVGGPYVLQASSEGATLSVRDVMSGDVWLCSGQSNMQFGLKESVGGAKAIADASQYPNLRLLEVSKSASRNPNPSQGGKWVRAAPETAASFSAVAYYFATELLKDPALAKVPMGLIDSSFGGTAIEGWIPKDGLTDVQPQQMSGSMFNIGPSTLYNGMIFPLSPCGLSGVLWYQGESNAGKPELYEQLLTTLITQWRQVWANPKLPFFIVQLPPFSGKFGGDYYTGLREAEAKVAEKVPGVGLAVTLGTTDGSNLHPTNKQPVGKRLALLALRDVYHEKIVAQGPIQQSVDIQGPVVRVKFDTGGESLVSRSGDELNGFALAGSDGIYQFASATIDGDSVVLRSDRVPDPKTVRYAFAGVPDADLYNSDGLPAAPFRTDDLPIKNMEFDQQPADRTLSTAAYDLTISGGGKITSLQVGNHQFFSNGFGATSGTSIPAMFGPSDLGNIKELGPNSISCNGSDFFLEITCDDTGMVWHMQNKGDRGTDFHIALAPWVVATQQDNETDLASGDARLKVEGSIQLASPTPEGIMLTVKVGAHRDADLKFSVVLK